MSGSILSHFNKTIANQIGTKTISEPDNGNKTTVVSATTPSSSSCLDFKKYEDRLKSFANWPNPDVSKEELAKAGFFYKNCNDIVECPYCHIEGYQWVAGDDPMEDHRSWSPHCPFVMMTSFETGSNNGRNVDTCGLYGVEILPNSLPEEESRLERLGINKTEAPAHPDKFSYDSRIKTFAAWPKSIKQTPHRLAQAGFIYVGVGDQTVCFQCGGGLKDWEENDDPFEEHALWFPKCPYLVLEKGVCYVQDVKQKRDPRRVQQSSTGGSPSTSQAKESPEESSAKSESLSADEDKQIDKTLCRICYRNEVGVVFLPCGHIVACVECSSALKRHSTLKNCAVCRKPVEATVRAFLS